MRISANSAFAYVDYVIALKWGSMKREGIVYSCYNRSEIELRSFTANLGLGNAVLYPEDESGSDIVMFPRMDADSYRTRMLRGKEPVCHSVSLSKEVGNRYIVTVSGNRQRDVYNWLMTNFDLPLLEEWVPYLLDAGKDMIRKTETVIYGQAPDWAEGLEAYDVSLTGEALRELVVNGLRSGRIRISEHRQESLRFDNMDDYFLKYGASLIDNLEKKLDPLVELKENVDEVAFLEKRFYPQQAAIVNGLIECMRHSSYVFMNEDMGCGKTLQAIGVMEGFFVRKAAERSGKPVKEIYMDSSLVKYRNIIMCPSHLVEKWAEAIRADVPYAKVVVIRGLKELCRLRKKGKERTGREFYILSKETGKLSYTYVPLPSQVKTKNAAVVVCRKCRKPRPVSMPKQCGCGNAEWETEDCGFKATGMVCPECGRLLYGADSEQGAVSPERGPLMPEDFSVQTKANRICRFCGTPLWQPACENVNRTMNFAPVKVRARKQWVKMTHWANKARKNKKTVWVHEKWKQEYIEKNDLQEDEITYPKVSGVRKFAPSRYIKKYLKGYFDFAVFDEAHEYKGGGSAQGMAMNDLVKASSRQLALTGTIAGGYANHFFYLLYRLDPAKMKGMGFSYGAEGERKFVMKYGTVSTEYEVGDEQEGSYNSMSRGRQLGSPKCKPGISLRIFTDFLLDKAVFLNLSDMSSFLPPLVEKVECIPIEDDICSEYNSVRERLKKAMYEKDLGKSILGAFLQFSLSYTDKPYGRSDILSPVDGKVVADIPDLSYLVSDGRLLNKEKRLCELVSEEISEDRNVFVYCEYTGVGEANVTHRLLKILSENCGLRKREVEILESSFPSAEEREAWMHERASKGVRVFITNPKCVKTGLDFLFYHKGTMYNFPTIIFYQYGYDLFTMWQASRRHYRLNQVRECRTFYLLSDRTVQLDALEMVASKQVATSAIQGHFSSEGLCAMAQGVDPRIKLAQAVSEKSPEQVMGVKSMFDVLNQWHAGNGEKAEYKKMLTFRELTGEEYIPDENSGRIPMAEGGADLFKYFGFGVSGGESVADAEEEEQDAGCLEVNAADETDEILEEEKESSEDSLFGLFGGQEEITGLFRKGNTDRKKRPSGMKALFSV
ncbi:MAG: hypothetical protein HFH85_20760 [Lachnospiraceae bacterium]|nr:hypothetical protein [Lachnospiraceae bacterium]